MVLLRSVIGQENSHHPLSRPDGKSMTNRDQFTRASSSLQFEFSLVNDDDYLG